MYVRSASTLPRYAPVPGMGEYFEGEHAPSVTAYRDGSLGLAATRQVMRRRPRIRQIRGVGQYAQAAAGCEAVGAADFIFSPGIAAMRAARNQTRGCGALGRGPDGLGQLDTAAGAMGGAMLAAMVVGTIIVGALSYQAGKAMTPSGSSKKTWGWIGVPVGMFTGAGGLGIMGWVSNAKSK